MKINIKNWIVITALLSCSLYLSTNAYAVCDPIRIMPLGDSLTYDNVSGDTRPSALRTGYRQPLWVSLTNAGYAADFVGSRIAGEDAIPDFDPDNEGYPGWTDDDIAATVYEFLVDNPADIVLLHIGTNAVSPDPAQVETILAEIDRFENDYDQHVIVILARIINRATYSSVTTQFNDNVQQMAENRIAGGDDILIVDMEDSAGLIYALQPNGDMHDNLHPTDDGYAKMADVWFDALVDILPECDPLTPHLYAFPSSVLVQMQGESSLIKDVKIDTSGPTGTDFVFESPNPAWVSFFPDSGTTTDTIEFSFDTFGLSAGVYTTDAILNSTDGNTLSATIPITLIVGNQLMLSQSASRSNAVLLSGTTVSGDVYVFVSPESNIKQAQFFIDNPGMTGIPDKIENLAPFDLGGTEASMDAMPFNTFQLSDGAHELSVKIVRASGSEESINAVFTVANTVTQDQLVFNRSALGFTVEEGGGVTATQTINLSASDAGSAAYTLGNVPSWLNISNQTGTTPNTLSVSADAASLSAGTYQAVITADASGYAQASFAVNLTVTAVSTGGYEALLSQSTNRSGAVPLSGATVSEDIYVFVSPETNVRQVQFFIDNPAMTGTPDKVEGLPPFDLGGTYDGSGNAMPYDTSQLSDGQHRLTIRVVTRSGPEAVVDATFTVANTVTLAQLVFNISSLDFTVEEGGGVTATQIIDLYASDAGSAAYTLGNVPSWLNISDQTGTTPNTLSVSADAASLSAGTYQAVITADAPGYAQTSLTVNLTVTAVSISEYNILLSQSANRSNPVPLSGAAVSGDIYVFVSPETNIRQVQFFIDNPAMTGTADKIENLPPYDLGGTLDDSENALPYNVLQLTDGPHALTIKVITVGGAEEILGATFTVEN